jgi:hypothetical protein
LFLQPSQQPGHWRAGLDKWSYPTMGSSQSQDLLKRCECLVGTTLFLQGYRLQDRRRDRGHAHIFPHTKIEKAKGIRVGEWLVSLKTDVVLLREDLLGKRPVYVFSDAGVEMRMTAAKTLFAAILDSN